MEMISFIWIGVFIISLVALLKASDYFTNAAEKIGLVLGLPSFIIGVTIVAVGTSLPELISSIFAVTSGNSEIVIGNVLGSNIANIFLVLGVVAIFARKIETKYEIWKVDLPIFFASMLFVLITCFDGVFNVWEGLIGLCGIVTYLIFAATSSSTEKIGDKRAERERKELKKQGLFIQFVILFISGFFIFLSAKYVVSSVVELSTIFNIAKDLIAVSAVAIGTSLPELMVGVQAARKGNAGMAFGNVLGSNIFNSFAVLGVSAFFGSLVIPSTMIALSIPVMIGSSFLFLFMIQDREITMWEGIILLLAYVLYMGKIFGLF